MTDDRTTAQGLFLQADAYLEAGQRLMDPISREGHASMPIRFLFYHAAELYLKSYLRVSGLSVLQIRKFDHKFSKIMDKCIELGLKISAHDYDVFAVEQLNEQIIRSRYIVTGTQYSVGIGPLRSAVEGVRFDVRHHPRMVENLVFRPWDKPQDTRQRGHLVRLEWVQDKNG